MFLEVIGGSKSQKKHTQGMVEFCANKLMPRLYNLDITVRLCKPKGALGYCLELEDKRTFELEIDQTQPLRQLLETVAHEMVHVKQYARRELHPSKEAWLGKTVNPKKVSYWDLPWEIEAHGREVGLFVRYCEENKLGKYKWTNL
mgnify:FL=1|jgi:hypothetical protein|tara:strand:+ start:2169 stop:2603 length:435 start_codon:yes stop_codon:yes gene_type:complete